MTKYSVRNCGHKGRGFSRGSAQVLPDGARHTAIERGIRSRRGEMNEREQPIGRHFRAWHGRDSPDESFSQLAFFAGGAGSGLLRGDWWVKRRSWAVAECLNGVAEPYGRAALGGLGGAGIRPGFAPPRVRLGP